MHPPGDNSTPRRRIYWRSLLVLQLRGRLALLVTVTALPLLGLGIGEAYLRYRAEWNGFGERTLELARAVARTVEADHRARVAGLRALALTRSLRADDLDAFRGTARAFLETQPRGSTLGLADETGQLLLAVGDDIPLGMPLPKRENMAILERVFRTGQPAVSELFTGAITRRRAYTVDVPVIREGRVVYDLGLDPTVASLPELIARQRLNAGWVVSIIDPQGVIVARWPNAERFVGQQVSPSLLSAFLSRPEGILESISLEGTPLITAFSHSEPSGWGVAIGAPTAEATGPLHNRLLALLGIGALVLLASITSAAAVARGITGPIASLTCFANVTGTEGNHPPSQIPATGLREVDEVGRVLAAATMSLRGLTETLEHRVEEEVAHRMQLEERLRQSQRMEAVGQLTAGVAHDFNNLLQAQMGALELLLEEVRGMNRAERSAQMAITSIQKGARLTHSLLSFSRQQTLRPEAVGVPELLGRLRMLLSRTLDPRIDLSIEIEAGLAPPVADPAQLETALLNLCLNARDAMQGRPGQLRVRRAAARQ